MVKNRVNLRLGRGFEVKKVVQTKGDETVLCATKVLKRQFIV